MDVRHSARRALDGSTTAAVVVLLTVAMLANVAPARRIVRTRDAT